MRFTLEIECDNDAFQGELKEMLAHLIRNVALKVECGADEGRVIDPNGNKVGNFRLTEED